MKPSIKKIYSIIKLEGERGFTNDAVIGGLDRILDHWEGEARIDNLPEDFIQAVISRMRDYPRLSQSSRNEILEGLWKRLGQIEASLADEPFPYTRAKAKVPSAAPDAPLQKKIPSAIPESITSAGKPKVHQDKGQVTSERSPANGAVEPAALNTSIQALQGIGPAHAKTLARLNIHTLRDALYYFPRRYDDYSLLKPINRLIYGEVVTVIGMLVSIKVRPIRNGKDQLVEAVIYDGTGSLRVNWFNQVHVAKRFQPKSEVVISGKVEQYLGRPVMNNPEIELIEQEHLSTNRIVPVYPLTAHITQRWLREKIHQVVRYWAPRLTDPLPQDILSSAELIDLPSAISQIHYPDSWETLEAARHRLAFDEILLLQLGVLRQKRDWQQREARIFAADPAGLQAQLERLPYALTSAQHNALQDILADLSSGRPMNRLLQGDVGSGKTIVAALAMAVVIEQEAQAALMVPTSILAEQHYQTLTRLLVHPDKDTAGNAYPLKPGDLRLLIGATTNAEKKEILAGLEAGTIKLVIGTHTLIEEPVTFANLQMIVVDEQHRFGVEQRAALRRKGENAHLLVMTATPIPRSLALTIYGDLDLSVMDELPPGSESGLTA